jgi:hypothetical protein
MKMIKCEACGHEISESASVCPHCGHRNKRSVGILLGLGIFFLPIIFAWFTLRKGHSTLSRVLAFGWLFLNILIIIGAESVEQQTAYNTSSEIVVSSLPNQMKTTNIEEEVISVGIRKILSDYEDNEVGADNTYKGKLVKVTGRVDSIKKDLFDNLYITLGTGNEFEIPMFQAFFDDSMKDTLGMIKRGSSLTVTCRVKGLMINVIGEDCIIH